MNLGKSILAILAIGTCCTASAHDFWVNGDNGHHFVATIGYGHAFPDPEIIPDGRLKLFDPLFVIKKDGSKTTLKQTSPNYQYEGQKLAAGSYILAGHYKPTFWTKDRQDKWHMDSTKQNVKDVASCSRSSMNAKAIIQVGNTEEAFLTRPSGQPLEIVPLTSPSMIKAEQPFKVQVFANNKPVAKADVIGTFDGFLKGKYAFSGRTDMEGIIEIIALKPGKWMLKASQIQPYHDLSVCDEEKLRATLTFNVKP